MFNSNTLAWKNGEWLQLDMVRLPLDDLGVMQGVTVVDRIRTIQHLPLDAPAHLARWRAGCKAVGIDLSNTDIELVLEELVQRNQPFFEQEDFSIVLLATPGPASSLAPDPTLILHTTPIAWSKLAEWYRVGQKLYTTGHHAVPAACWPSTIKTRSRLNYFLADQQAQLQSGDPAASGVLLAFATPHALTITETSIANLLIVEREARGQLKVISPPQKFLLDGISLQRTVRLAQQAGYSLCYEAISEERAEQAEEIILTGSTGCIWPAASLNDRKFENATQQSVYRTLLAAWQRELVYDFTV